MEIVPFAKQDQEAAATFMRQIYLEMHWNKHPLIGTEDLETFFHLPQDGVLFLIKDAGTIIGTGGWVKISDKDALLKRFFISQSARGSGIAEVLFQKLMVYAKKHSMSRMVIDVSKENSRAIHFFEKNGFQQYHQEPREEWSETKYPDIFNYYFLELDK